VVAVTDTAASVATNLAALQALVTSTKLATITVSDVATARVAITAAQATADVGAIGKMTGTGNVTITDTVANVVANLTNIQTNNTEVYAIVLTDASPVLALTAAQLNNNAAAIAKITSTYKETITATANTTETFAGTGSLNTLTFNSETQGVTANLSTGVATTVHSATTFTTTISGFQNVIGSTFADTLTAGSANGYLTGNGGVDTYVLSGTGIDAVKDTAAHLNGNTVQNFTTLDGIDLTTVTFASNPTLGFSEDASNTFGTLTVTDGTHAASILLLGQYTAASFQKVSDGGTGTLVAVAGTANLTAILAAAHG
jgi:hypothetical protein